MKLSEDTKNRRLLMTMTGEPFQPVRLYYAIPDRSFVIKKLRSLKCMVEAPHEQCWQWLFEAESKSLRFPGSYDDVPKEKRPLAPEEETPEFRDLTLTLQLRGIRALEHWNGNTHLTLAAIITRMVEQNEQFRNK
jgi:hypothetical protein